MLLDPTRKAVHGFLVFSVNTRHALPAELSLSLSTEPPPHTATSRAENLPPLVPAHTRKQELFPARPYYTLDLAMSQRMQPRYFCPV